MKCLSINRSGQQCGSYALVGTQCCSIHSEPGRAAVLARNRKRRIVTEPSVCLKQFATPQSVEAFQAIIAESVIELRKDLVTLDPRTANAIALLVGAYLRANEAGALERRVMALEQNRTNTEGAREHRPARTN